MAVVVISGATGEVAKATAALFADKGYDLALISDRGLETFDNEMAAYDGRVQGYEVDGTNCQHVSEIAARIQRQQGPISIWINQPTLPPLEDQKAEELRRSAEATYLRYIYSTMACLKLMRQYNSGHIVQVGVALDIKEAPLLAPFKAAKQAVKGFTESLRAELLQECSGIIVNRVHLPASYSWLPRRRAAKLFPPRIDPEIAAQAIYYAATHKVSQVKLGFRIKRALFGNKPAFASWYLDSKQYVAQPLHNEVRQQRTYGGIAHDLFTPSDSSKLCWNLNHGANARTC